MIHVVGGQTVGCLDTARLHTCMFRAALFFSHPETCLSLALDGPLGGGNELRVVFCPAFVFHLVKHCAALRLFSELVCTS